MGQCMEKLQGWWTNEALGVKSAMFMYDVKGTAQPAPWGEAQLNKSTQYVWGKVPHKLREFVLFMLLWTELKFSCCWFTEILQVNLLSFFLTFWDCFQVSGEVFISTSSAHELTSCVWILWSRQCILKTESKSFKKKSQYSFGRMNQFE